MTAAVDAVAQVLLRPDDISDQIDRCRDRQAAQPVAVLRFELVPGVDRLVLWRELHMTGRCGAADAWRGPAVNLDYHAADGVGVRALVHAVPLVFLRPDDVALVVHRRGGWSAPQTVAVLRFELASKIERLVAWWKRDGAGASARAARV